MISEKFVILGAIISLSGSLAYVRATLRGKTQPNRVSWFMWALAPLVAFAAQIDKGVGLIALMTFMVGFGPLLVFIASFVNKNAVWKLGPFDIICGMFSLAGLVLWLITKEGNIGIAFAIAADTLAALPTIVKSYTNPETENHWAFTLAAISAGIAMLTIDQWTFAHYGFSVYIFSICILLASLIKFKLGKRFPIKFAI